MKNKKRLNNYAKSISRIQNMRESLASGMYSSMLIEDITLHCLPYDNYENPSFTVDLEKGGNDDEREELCLALNSSRRSDLKDSVTDFIRNTTKCILYDGYVYYRIYYTDDAKQRFKFLRLHNEKVVSIFGLPLYFRQAGLKLQSVENDRYGKTVKFGLPSELQFLPNLLKQLARRNPTYLPTFALDQFHPEIPTPNRTPVDLNLIRESELKRIAQLTHKIGWTGRGLFNDKITEYYMTYRELLFRQQVIRLRNTIIKDLNRLLSSISSDLSFPKAISIKGLRNEEELFHSNSLLRNGAAPFSKIIEPLLRS